MAKNNFSIIVPCFNSASTLDRCVSSILNQTYEDFTLILIDDGSTDATSDMCDEYAARDNRIKVIHQPNGGQLRARKIGINASATDYIIFCDSDDYIDDNLLEMVRGISDIYTPDMIIHGMSVEYINGESVRRDNRISPGMHNKRMIENHILPNLYSDGSMQSELIIKSCWAKVFRRSLLQSVMDDIPDRQFFGEDQLMVFCSLLRCKSIYNMTGEYPYHYVRSSQSDIGKYDRKIFEKIDTLYVYLNDLARLYGYNYIQQIEYDRLSTTLLYIKKEIQRNPNGYRDVSTRLEQVLDSVGFTECMKRCDIKGYNIFSKVFAEMILRRRFLTAYIFVRVIERFRGRMV